MKSDPFEEKVRLCAKNIKNRLGLKELPSILVINRPFVQVGNSGHSVFKSPRGVNVEVVEDTERYEEYTATFKELYKQLSSGFRRKSERQSVLIEILVKLKEIAIPAGHSWTYIGTQKNQRFMAILSLYTRELFRGCGLSTLLKLKEIELAIESECAFIQTYHDANNPRFLAAIAPSLKTGFFLYHGEDSLEFYEDWKNVHLRKYLDGESYSARVKLGGKRRKTVVSPLDNMAIIEALAAAKGLCGGVIKHISSPIEISTQCQGGEEI